MYLTSLEYISEVKELTIDFWFHMGHQHMPPGWQSFFVAIKGPLFLSPRGKVKEKKKKKPAAV